MKNGLKLLLVSITVWPVAMYATHDHVTQFATHTYQYRSHCVIRTSNPLHYHAFILHNPPRVVIDIDEVYRSNVNTHVPPGIKSVRYAHKRNHSLRVVFDLNHPQAVSIQNIKYAYVSCLMVKFKPADKQTIIINPVKKALMPIVAQGRRVLVVIDPGHGGKDPGAVGPNGAREKHIVFRIARALQVALNNQSGFHAVLTRRGDYYLTLRQRLSLARNHHPDMFVAIHADAYPQQAARGVSVFALSRRGATSEAARWLAKKENESELMGGVELNDKSTLLRAVLLNLSQIATLRASLRIGSNMITSLREIGYVHRKKVEQAAFVVLKSPDIPSLLVETGFISNNAEERQLSSIRYQRRIAAAIMQGIRNYFVHWSPHGTWLSLQPLAKRIHPEHYVVKYGDTLSVIALEHNVSMEQLKYSNHLTRSNLQVGQRLVVPIT